MSDEDFAKHMERVALALLGEPNRRLSKAKELRFGTNGSLSVDLEKGSWFSHEAEQGGGVLALIEHVKGLKGGEASDFMRDDLGLDVGGHDRPKPKTNGGTKPGPRKIVAIYDYRDRQDNLLFQVVRYEPKDFRQRRPDGAGKWVWDVRGVPKVPFNLPAVLEAIAGDRRDRRCVAAS